MGDLILPNESRSSEDDRILCNRRSFYGILLGCIAGQEHNKS